MRPFSYPFVIARNEAIPRTGGLNEHPTPLTLSLKFTLNVAEGNQMSVAIPQKASPYPSHVIPVQTGIQAEVPKWRRPVLACSPDP